MRTVLPESPVHRGFSPAQARALKERLRALRWQPEAVMREVVLIQRLRELALPEPGDL